jgi:manganese/zinc/iron transport system permease protein
MALARCRHGRPDRVFWRWLKIATFDEGFANALGIPAAAVGFGLVIASALAAVAAFEAVGSIIVIAMFICPPATARLMTSSLERQVLWSVVFATVSAVLGYVLAGYGPLWLGAADSVSAAGMMATVSGAPSGSCLSFRTHRHRVGAAGALRRLIPRRRTAVHPAGFTASSPYS